MLKLNEIKTFYPKSLHGFPRFMLREYLQYKILEIVFNSDYKNSINFMGGTCLRIVHGNQRFSEDLDFDNINLSEDNFKELAKSIKKGLVREGYKVEINPVFKGAWHCNIKFPGLLFEEGLSGYNTEKILIRLDTEPQNYFYEPEKYILNKFEIFTTIFNTPLSTLFSQKLFTVLNRKRKMGRDFFDIVFLMGKGIQPDYNYLAKKANITSHNQIKKDILATCNPLDMKKLARDVEPFVFEKSALKRVLLFKEYFKQNF